MCCLHAQIEAQIERLPSIDWLAQNYQPPFDPSFNPTTQQPFGRPPQSPPDSYTKQSVSSGEHLGPSHYPGSIEGRDEFLADPGLIRSSSEEKDKEGLAGTPAQSKRKAQNRAAYVCPTPNPYDRCLFMEGV